MDLCVSLLGTHSLQRGFLYLLNTVYHSLPHAGSFDFNWMIGAPLLAPIHVHTPIKLI